MKFQRNVVRDCSLVQPVALALQRDWLDKFAAQRLAKWSHLVEIGATVKAAQAWLTVMKQQMGDDEMAESIRAGYYAGGFNETTLVQDIIPRMEVCPWKPLTWMLRMLKRKAKVETKSGEKPQPFTYEEFSDLPSIMQFAVAEFEKHQKSFMEFNRAYDLVQLLWTAGQQCSDFSVLPLVANESVKGKDNCHGLATYLNQQRAALLENVSAGIRACKMDICENFCTGGLPVVLGTIGLMFEHAAALQADPSDAAAEKLTESLCRCESLGRGVNPYDSGGVGISAHAADLARIDGGGADDDLFAEMEDEEEKKKGKKKKMGKASSASPADDEAKEGRWKQPVKAEKELLTQALAACSTFMQKEIYGDMCTQMVTAIESQSKATAEEIMGNQLWMVIEKFLPMLPNVGKHYRAIALLGGEQCDADQPAAAAEGAPAEASRGPATMKQNFLEMRRQRLAAQGLAVGNTNAGKSEPGKVAEQPQRDEVQLRHQQHEGSKSATADGNGFTTPHDMGPRSPSKSSMQPPAFSTALRASTSTNAQAPTSTSGPAGSSTLDHPPPPFDGSAAFGQSSLAEQHRSADLYKWFMNAAKDVQVAASAYVSGCGFRQDEHGKQLLDAGFWDKYYGHQGGSPAKDVVEQAMADHARVEEAELQKEKSEAEQMQTSETPAALVTLLHNLRGSGINLTAEQLEAGLAMFNIHPNKKITSAAAASSSAVPSGDDFGFSSGLPKNSDLGNNTMEETHARAVLDQKRIKQEEAQNLHTFRENCAGTRGEGQNLATVQEEQNLGENLTTDEDLRQANAEGAEEQKPLQEDADPLMTELKKEIYRNGYSDKMTEPEKKSFDKRWADYEYAVLFSRYRSTLSDTGIIDWAFFCSCHEKWEKTRGSDEGPTWERWRNENDPVSAGGPPSPAPSSQQQLGGFADGVEPPTPQSTRDEVDPLVHLASSCSLQVLRLQLEGMGYFTIAENLLTEEHKQVLKDYYKKYALEITKNNEQERKFHLMCVDLLDSVESWRAYIPGLEETALETVEPHADRAEPEDAEDMDKRGEENPVVSVSPGGSHLLWAGGGSSPVHAFPGGAAAALALNTTSAKASDNPKGTVTGAVPKQPMPSVVPKQPTTAAVPKQPTLVLTMPKSVPFIHHPTLMKMPQMKMPQIVPQIVPNPFVNVKSPANPLASMESRDGITTPAEDDPAGEEGGGSPTRRRKLNSGESAPNLLQGSGGAQSSDWRRPM
eukprot:g1932.t1